MRKIGFVPTSLNNESKSEEQEKPWKKEYSKNSTIFGKNVFLPINMKKQLNDNVLVLGTSGTGKTYSFVEPNILQGNTNYVIADAKGDILRNIGASLIKMGYKLQVINLVDLKHSMTYNPLNYANDQLSIMHFADKVVSSDITGKMSTKNSSQDPFWDNAAEDLLESLIFFVKEFLPLKEQNMASVINLYNIVNMSPKKINDVLTSVNHGELSKYYELTSVDDNDSIGNHIFNWARRKNPNSQAVKAWDLIASNQIAEKTWSNVYGILGSSLTRYTLSDVLNLTSSNQVEFSELLKPKTALFILYDDADDSKNFISDMLYTQLFSYLYEAARSFENKLPVKVRFFLDDFKNIHIPNFDDYLATARSRNISICMMLQNESQLVAKFHENTPSVIGNCAAYLLTGTTDLEMAKIASSRFNLSTNTIRQKNYEQFLLDISGYISYPIRYDFQKHPAYYKRVFDVNKHFVTPSIQDKKNISLLNILKSMSRSMSKLAVRPINPFDYTSDEDRY